MKKLFSILLLLTFLINSTSIIYATGELTLSDTTIIAGANGDISFAKPTADEKHSGEYSLHFKAASDALQVSQNFETPLEAGQYVLTVYARPVTGRLWFYVNWDGTGWMATHAAEVTEAQPEGWKRYQKTITVDGTDDTKLLFYSDVASEFYVDDISLVKVGETENLMPDGGFEEVTVEGGSTGGGDAGDGGDIEDGGNPGDGIDDEKLTLSNTTTIQGTQNENRYARATDDEKHGGNYSLRLYSTTASFEFGQNYTMANLPAGEYTVTWYVKGNDGTMLFSNNWGEGVYNVHLTPTEEDGWKKYTKTLTLDGSEDTRFLFYADTAIDCYIDDISLVDANGVNYIIDGGFEEVTVEGGNTGDEEDTTGAHDRYKNELKLSDTTKISGANGTTCKAEASEDEAQDGYSLHFVSSGDAEFKVSQNTTTPLEAGESYLLTVYAKPISGRVWFRAGWGNDAWTAIDGTSEGTDMGDGWKKYERTLIIGSDGATELFFYSDQDTEFYLDDISLVKAGKTENLMPDGDFSEVTVIAPEIPPYEVLAHVLKKGKEIVDTISGAGTYTVTVAAKNNALKTALPVELLVAVFDSAGVMLELYSDDAEVEKTEPRANDTVLSVSFEVAEGYSAEVYVINDRQKIDVYHNPVNYKYVTIIPDAE